MTEGELVLKKHWFHILLALAQGPSHGAEIRRRVRRNSQDTLELYPAMLYGSLEDLEEAGLIRELSGEEVPDGANGPRSRFHELTLRGREALAAEAEAYRAVAETALGYLAREGGKWA